MMKRVTIMLLAFALMPIMALAATLSDGLVAHYKFDGNANDSSGNGRGLTLEEGRVSYAVGVSGDAVYFDGASLLSRRGAERFDVECNFTVSCWVKTDANIKLPNESTSGIVTGGDCVFGPAQCVTYGNEDGTGIGFAVGTNGVVVYEHWNYSLPAVLVYEHEMGVGWNFIAVRVQNDGAPELYVNGKLVKTGLDSGRKHRCACVESIGEGAYGYSKCYLDDLRIYNCALSEAEIKSLSAVTWYVDDAAGNDANSGRDRLHAKKTIQAAIDVATDGDAILVAPGTYAPIDAKKVKALLIESQLGAAVTVIDAKNECRCVTMSHPSSVIRGFTLVNGQGVAYDEDGGGIRGGRAERCVITKCWGYAPAAAYGELSNCLIVGNGGQGDRFGVCSWCWLENCTIADNSVSCVCWDCGACNSILKGGTIYTSVGDAINYYNCLTDKQMDPEDGNKIGDPKFVDSGNENYRLASDSLCIDAGDAQTDRRVSLRSPWRFVIDATKTFAVGKTDLEGCGRIANGVVDIGCYEFEPDGGPYVEKVGDIDWTYMIKGGRASLGDGASAAAPNLAGSVSVPVRLRQRPVVAIDAKAFVDCPEVTSVKIPQSVIDIGDSAFKGCNGLRDVYLKGNMLSAIDSEAFVGCHWDLIVHVPADWQGRGRTLCGYTVWRAGSSDEEKFVCMAVTNVIAQYVLNSIQPSIAVPVSGDTGFVTVITEVKSSGAVAVPSEWKDNYPNFAAKYGTDFGKALMMKSGKKDGAGNDMFVWQDYVAGTDPTNPDDKFTASVTIVEGVPVISWTPELPAEQAALRKYTTYGKAKLQDAEWSVVNGDETSYNFFKVTVEMK